MSIAKFESAVTDLFVHIGLEAPDFSKKPEITIAVEEIDVVLSDAGDGFSMIISSTAGRLTDLPVMQMSQYEKLLKLNLALSLSHDTLTKCETLADGRGEISIESRYQYAAYDVPKLSDLISDGVSAAETYERVLTGAGRAASVPMAPTLSDEPFEEAIIFQP